MDKTVQYTIITNKEYSFPNCINKLCVSLKTPPRRKYYLDKIELIYEGWNFSGTTFSISIKQSSH